MKKIVILLIILLLTIKTITAIGITPGKTYINSIKQEEQTIEFKILNNEHKDMKVIIYPDGELKDLITLKDKEIQIKQDQNEITTSYKIKLGTIEKPGKHTVRITAMEVNNNNQETLAVGFNTAVATQLFVTVPYPDKYLEPEFYVKTENDGSIKLLIQIINLGLKDITNAQATIELYDNKDQKFFTTITDTKSLKSLDKTELVAIWNSNLKPGKNYAQVTVNYDGQKATLKKDFELKFLVLDLLNIDLLGISVKDFRLGGIAKFVILIENKENSKIEEVYGDMKIADYTQEIKTAATLLEQAQRSSLYAYWDTEGVKVGTYDSTLGLHSGDKRDTEKKIRVNVKEDKITVDIPGTGYAINENSNTDISTTTWVITIVGLLIVTNAAIYFYFKKKKDEQKDKNETKTE